MAEVSSCSTGVSSRGRRRARGTANAGSAGALDHRRGQRWARRGARGAGVPPGKRVHGLSARAWACAMHMRRSLQRRGQV